MTGTVFFFFFFFFFYINTSVSWKKKGKKKMKKEKKNLMKLNERRVFQCVDKSQREKINLRICVTCKIGSHYKNTPIQIYRKFHL